MKIKEKGLMLLRPQHVGATHSRRSTRKKVGDEAIHKELGNRMERAATIASSFEAEQDSATDEVSLAERPPQQQNGVAERKNNTLIEAARSNVILTLRLLFDVDSLTISINYVPVVVGNQTNGIARTRDNIVTGQAEKKTEPEQEYILIPFCTTNPYVGAAADLNNLETTMNVSPIPTTRIDKDHPKDQIIGDLNSAIQTRRMTKISDEHAMVKPKKVIQALEDPSWIEEMQEELLQFQLQKIWILIDLPNGKRAIGTKWVFRNNKDERRNC
ncbi:hypothetical protein Tco_0948012 [Tanacetum coccineum]